MSSIITRFRLVFGLTSVSTAAIGVVCRADIPPPPNPSYQAVWSQDFTKMTRVARLVYEIGWRVANLDHRLSINKQVSSAN